MTQILLLCFLTAYIIGRDLIFPDLNKCLNVITSKGPVSLYMFQNENYWEARELFLEPAPDDPAGSVFFFSVLCLEGQRIQQEY